MCAPRSSLKMAATRCTPDLALLLPSQKQGSEAALRHVSLLLHLLTSITLGELAPAAFGPAQAHLPAAIC